MLKDLRAPVEPSVSWWCRPTSAALCGHKQDTLLCTIDHWDGRVDDDINRTSWSRSRCTASPQDWASSDLRWQSSAICHQHIAVSRYGFVNMSLKCHHLESVLFDFSILILQEVQSGSIFQKKKECRKCSSVLSKWKTGGLLTNWSVCAWPLLFLCPSQTQGSPTIASLWRTGNRKSALHLAPCEFTGAVPWRQTYSSTNYK